MQASEDWCTALWVAEKHITQRVQPLVRSPILTSYARGAYHLRQKPCVWCCTSCCDWVRKQSEAQQLLVEPSWGPIPGVWPQLGEAAITGARFFPVDFEKKTPGHDESANMGIPLPLGTQVTSSSDRTWNTSWKGRGPQSKRRPARKKHRKPEESGDPSSQQGSFSKSSRRPARKQPSEPTGDPLVKAEEGSDTHSSPGLAKELSQRADTCPRVALRSLLQTPPASDLQSKEAQLLQWVEDALVEGTLGHWVAYRIMTCLLESREEDTIGILAAVEEVTGAHEFVLLQANVTTYRQEVKQWLLAQAACLQETHVVAAEQQKFKNGLSSGSCSAWIGPAEKTPGGSMGGVASLARCHLQTRSLGSHLCQGKGFVVFGIRFQGWDLAVCNLYLESGVGPAAGVNPGILASLVMFIQELRIPWMILGDWNCAPQELASTVFLKAVKGKLVAPLEATTSQGSSIDYAVVCEALQAHIQIQVDWDVSFKPHAALRYVLQKNSLTLPVPQLTAFQMETC